MNVELINPALVLGLFASSAAAEPKSGRRLASPWAGRLRARFRARLRYRRALHELHQLDDRELDDLNIARADLRALARRDANGLEPLARS